MHRVVVLLRLHMQAASKKHFIGSERFYPLFLPFLRGGAQTTRRRKKRKRAVCTLGTRRAEAVRMVVLLHRGPGYRHQASSSFAFEKFAVRFACSRQRQKRLLRSLNSRDGCPSVCPASLLPPPPHPTPPMNDTRVSARMSARVLLGEALRRQGQVHDRRLGGAKHGQHPAVF